MATVEQDNDNRRLERLETRMGAMEVRMGAMEARMDAMWSILTELLADRRESNRRIDRLFYTLVGIGGGIIAALVVMIIRGGASG